MTPASVELPVEPPVEPGAVLSARALNRALLQRQWLLERRTASVPEALAHLVGMQSQAPEPPFAGLWTRVSGFVPAGLDELMASGAAVRMATLRGTLHLMTAHDAVAVRGLLQPWLVGQVRRSYRHRLAGADPAEIGAAAEGLLGDGVPRTFAQIAAALGPRWPDVPAQVLGAVVRAELALVQVPPRGLWNRSGPAAHVLARDRVDASVQPLTEGELVRRYLAAYGPAAVRDVQTWCGLSGLAAHVPADLVRYRDEAGRELLDLPGAPLPGPDAEAPVRFLPAWDNLLLSHADRSRVLPAQHAAAVFTVNGIVHPTVLVDGFVAATWRLERSGPTVVVRPLAPLGASDRAAVTEEARGVLAFLVPDGEGRPDVQVLDPP